LDMQKKIINEFQSWVWKDEDRKSRLQKIYEEKYCSNAVRHYDGGFLTFPQMNPDEELFDYQKNAVARIMFSPNTLLAHDVGAGKTYIMTAAGMEMRRIGTSKKNLYVVPNNLVGQWKQIFLRLYPKADLLCVDPVSFKKEKRQEVLKSIRDNDYDGIIMAYSCFELIPLSKEFYRAEMEKQIEEINKRAKQENKVTYAQKKKRDALSEALEELKNAIEDEYDIIYFDDLGINTMFVDEAHNFKNVPIETKISRVPGISGAGSSKCRDMMDKVREVQKNNNGGGVVFATGTPITNSLTDIFIMQKYLQNGELALLDLQSFDSWVGMFAEKNSELEVDVDTNNYRMTTRFSKFHNMPELSVLLASVTDFYQVDKTNGLPQTNGYRDIIIAKTDELGEYLDQISHRADDVRKGNVSRTDDNMLKITTDGRKAALDLRLVDKNAVFNYQCKAAYCAENIFDIYVKTADRSSAQLVFCDTSTPKAGFNLYDELKRLLVAMGLPAESIAYIHDAENEKQRTELFKKVREGAVRVLIGSTFKLGMGVNVQNKLYAIHHLDVPWRPSDMIQREGRILRKGNENKTVEIYRYIAEGSFDAYSWQLLETKQRMICAILSGCMTDRMCAEIADTALDYAEVKAISIGNPLLKKRVETANELSKYRTIQRKLIETRQNLAAELAVLPGKIKDKENYAADCKKDMEFYNLNKREYDKKERKGLRQLIYSAVVNNELAARERVLCNYQGFNVVLPANMLKARPFVYIERYGRYYIEMGFVESGVLIRIDNFLEELNGLLEKTKSRLADLYQREKDIKAELKKEDGYSDVIEALKTELAEIDKKLGVK
ncbi:MAG: helicase-related protein, partial [Candidatus Ornithomonoglobus sp.]